MKEYPMTTTRTLVMWQSLLVTAALASCGPMPGEEEGDDLETSVGEITSGGVYILKNVNSGKCVDVSGASTTAGANIQQWDCNSHTNQQFKFTDMGGGVFKVQPMNSAGAQCMDVFQASLVNGGNIDQWSCNGHTSQQFKLAQPSSGKFTITAVNSGKCLDVAGASLLRGANIQQWGCNGHNNQLFTFTQVSSGGGGSGGTGGSSGGTGGSTGTPTAAQLLAKTTSCTQASVGKYATDEGASSTVPICRLNGAFFWKSDMDIDCDGKITSTCNINTDPDFQSQTSAETSTGTPMDASLTPFFVIPLPSSRFDYTKNNIVLGQVGAVIFNGKVVYGVFADEGPNSIIGEASNAMAKALGIPADPSSGGVDSGVTFMVFTGSAGVVSPIEDHNKATSVGVARANAMLNSN
jgi:hypothetical protein